VSAASDVQELIEYVSDTMGPVDILVNNAGISRRLAFLEISEEQWDRTMDVNLKGAFLCARGVIPGMIEKGGGKIINMSSQSGKRGSSWNTDYSVSKFGIIGLTQCLAMEFAQNNILVNAVCPGIVFTSLWENTLAPDFAQRSGMTEEQVRDYLTGNIPLGRLGTPENVTDLVLFLASSRSDYITGQAINVNGGTVMY
jgi:NAD(P)-dependent dehydrogenase (short-subunit alcohol dehydrogenase family)